MVCALRFTDDGVYCANQFVRGRKFVREEHGPVFRTFGTAFPGDRLKRGIGTESPYNVSVYQYRNKLLAFGEQSLPMELDSATLETKTPGKTFDFDGQLNDAAPFSAHPKIDSRTGELLNFGIFFSPDDPVLIYYRFDEAGKLACRKRVSIDYPSSTHDFTVSENYAVFYLSPHLLDVSAIMKNGVATIDALSWQPELGSRLVVLCRKTGKEIARIKIDGRYCLHTINAFEQGRQLIVDIIELERPIYDQYQTLPEMFLDVPFGKPTRMVIDLDRQSVISKATIEYDCAPDFPVIHPQLDSRQYDDLWMLGISRTGQPGSKFLDQLVHAKWSQPDQVDIWRCPSGQYMSGEPVFVSDPDHKNQGVIICPVLDETKLRTYFAIFGANCVAAGPIAKLTLRQAIHLGFHATFSSSGFDRCQNGIN
jgi:all-trans-8'-apo-beta-carotenal 15,15'-oxygenase